MFNNNFQSLTAAKSTLFMYIVFLSCRVFGKKFVCTRFSIVFFYLFRPVLFHSKKQVTVSSIQEEFYLNMCIAVMAEVVRTHTQTHTYLLSNHIRSNKSINRKTQKRNMNNKVGQLLMDIRGSNKGKAKRRKHVRRTTATRKITFVTL